MKAQSNETKSTLITFTLRKGNSSAQGWAPPGRSENQEGATGQQQALFYAQTSKES